MKITPLGNTYECGKGVDSRTCQKKLLDNWKILMWKTSCDNQVCENISSLMFNCLS